MRDTRVLGEKLPSEFLDHLLGLLPDVTVLFEVALLDALPANARVAALQHSDLRSMARAADAVILENRASEQSDLPSLLAVSVDPGDDTPLLTPSPAHTVAAVSQSQRSSSKPGESVCSNHRKFGRNTYKCLAPGSCKMRSVLKPRPQPQVPASGNGKAGGQ